MLHHYGERVHKIAIDADFTCRNRDGSKGRGEKPCRHIGKNQRFFSRNQNDCSEFMLCIMKRRRRFQMP